MPNLICSTRPGPRRCCNSRRLANHGERSLAGSGPDSRLRAGGTPPNPTFPTMQKGALIAVKDAGVSAPEDITDMSGQPELGHIGAHAARPRAEVEFLVVAQASASEATLRKSAEFTPWCRSKPSKAKALREVAARGVQNQGAASAAPKQCADKGLPRHRANGVPVSFILPSALSSLPTLRSRYAARRPLT